MRVLLAVDSLTTGGAERHVVDLARALRARAHDVAVACSASGPLERELEAAGVPIDVVAPELVKRRLCPRYVAGLRAAAETFEPDIVHAHLFASAAAAASAVQGSGVPLVVTEQTEAPWRSNGDRALSRRVHRQAAHIIAVSSRIRAGVLAESAVAADRVSVVPNAVTGGVSQLAEALPGGRPLVGTVARLVPEKGVDTLLRAARLVAKRVPGVTFVIAGDGPLRQRLERLLDDLSLDGTVHFVGHREDGPAIVRHADVLAVPSRAEGTPLVIAEALEAATPIVATPVGGIPDQIRDGREGLLVPPDDPGALADALVRVLTEPRLAGQLAEHGRRRSRQFGHDAMVDRIECLLLSAAEAGAGVGFGARAAAGA